MISSDFLDKLAVEGKKIQVCICLTFLCACLLAFLFLPVV